MMLPATVIQNMDITEELVYDTFWKEIFGIEKVSLPASSDDAASNSDTKYVNYVGIWYVMLFRRDDLKLIYLNRDIDFLAGSL
jgi:hypothetical protein